ncbi:cellulase family glycosylhydrolase [Candidatus Woesebacteria bacterium]|nr:cellulase family glycosylhydrolase [Candidatus Woesebacteria bacterium]MCD8507769.1 cellulase family glycosylhydrolase [Candidatus Woesebacteria bacterium]MCD8526956.1 cellulase family glycosylhydrolase [Candidatus Woesebacteria bacterium]MCD8545873.1 cellulase family glycosylhydrolase [Candidatus Woesebacteria bacterium]
MKLTHIMHTIKNGLAVFLAMVGLFFFTSPVAAQSIPTPLSTNGSRIVDANGNTTQLKGINWFGFETDLYVVHGLWEQGYDEMLQTMADLGYNTIRLPFSHKALDMNEIKGVNYRRGANANLRGKTPLQAMDIIIQEAAKHDILILLDSHRLNDQNIPALWYSDEYSEEDWINDWTMLAERYKNQSNVIGADLKNEPHSIASWGTNNLATDWRLAAERAGNAILRVNPEWLIVVEGVQGNVQGGTKLKNNWWGGNLEGARNYPVRLNVPNKLVYSTHEYGPGVYEQAWFEEPTFPNNLYERWDIGFFYLIKENIAPVLIGEFGGFNVDTVSKEGIWQNQLVDFIAEHDISFTYWTWNPNSGDTGGVLNSDWRTINQPKQDMLNRILFDGLTQPTPTPSPTPTPTPTPVATPVPTPTPTPTPTPVPTPTPAPGDENVSISFQKDSEWENGYCGKFVIQNGNNQQSNWRIQATIRDAQITGAWNAATDRNSGTVTFTPAGWMQPLAAGRRTTDIGFCANKSGSQFLPTAITVTSTAAAPVPTGSLETRVERTSQWNEGYCANVTVRNTSGQAATNWSTDVNVGSDRIYTNWSANFSGSTGNVRITAPHWATTLSSGASHQFGFCAYK